MKILYLTLFSALFINLVFGNFVGGRYIQSYYNGCGLWNNLDVSKGLQLEECCRVDMSFPGTPWNQLDISYTVGNGPLQQYTGNTFGCNYQVIDSQPVFDIDSITARGISHTISAGILRLTKTEIWDFDNQYLIIEFVAKINVVNCTGCDGVTGLTIVHGVDPDQDVTNFYQYSTINDRFFGEYYAESVGKHSCWTVGYGLCNIKQQIVGHTPWQSFPAPLDLGDYGGAFSDDTIHFLQKPFNLLCGESKRFRFVVTFGTTPAESRSIFLNNFRLACESFKDSPNDKDVPSCTPCDQKCPCSTATKTRCGCKPIKPVIPCVSTRATTTTVPIDNTAKLEMDVAKYLKEGGYSYESLLISAEALVSPNLRTVLRSEQEDP